MKAFFSSALLILPLLSHLACGSDGSAEADSTGDGAGSGGALSKEEERPTLDVGSAEATINGEDHEFVVRWANVISGGNVLYMEADPITDFTHTLFIWVEPISGPGSYRCGGSNGSKFVLEKGASSSGSSSNDPCEIVIQEFGNPGEPIRGTFQGETFTGSFVYEGSFDVIRGE